MPMAETSTIAPMQVDARVDWRRIARLVMLSRRLDIVEETRLVPQKKVLYQFSARGHELAQTILGGLLTDPHDAASPYYRSRPLLLTLGFDPVDALAASMAKIGSQSGGRDVGAIHNLPSKKGVVVLPTAGGVGSQYTPAAGWAQAIVYRHQVLRDDSYRRSMAVVLGGDGSVASNGFWSALNLATTRRLPLLFFIEDNGFAISVPSTCQTPGGNIAGNLASYKNLRVLSGDGADPVDATHLVHEAVDSVREGGGPVLLRLTVPRLCGHSIQDNQAYKGKELLEQEASRDPLARLFHYLVPAVFSETEWRELERAVEDEVERSVLVAMERPDPDPGSVSRHVFAEELQLVGGLAADGHRFPGASETVKPEPPRINMGAAIARTLEYELQTNPKMVLFGEDVGAKGGVHAITAGFQNKFGKGRVWDTSLSEEGIIGSAVGMALAGLMPAAEIQFRKYAEPATEQLDDCGTLRWRTNNRFAAPILVRMPCGFSNKCGDPWHSVTNEAFFAHAAGWQVLFPSNAEDATGLLRSALRSNNPTIFLEHRALLDGASARRPYPGDQFVVPIGKARKVREGDRLTVVAWGAMLDRCVEASESAGVSVEIIDLRSIIPWDKEAVLASVNKTHRCLVVHEDGFTAGFGAEIVATLAKESFYNLDAPVERMTAGNFPRPYNIGLMQADVPTVARIAERIAELVVM